MKTFGLNLAVFAGIMLSLGPGSPAARAHDTPEAPDVVFVCARPLGDPDWSVAVKGTIAGHAVDYDGTATITTIVRGMDSVAFYPVFPGPDAPADFESPMFLAVSTALVGAPDSQTGLVLTVLPPRADSADPEGGAVPPRTEPVDPELSPKSRTTMRASQTPDIHIVRDNVRLSVAQTYVEIATRYGLRKADAEAFLRGELDADQTVAAFRRAAVDNLAIHGISKDAARDIYDLRLAHGDSPAYSTDAFALLRARGEPIDAVLNPDGGQDAGVDDPDGVLATRVQDPRDLGFEIVGTVVVQVRVPPKVDAKARITVTVRGNATAFARLQRELADALDDITPVVEAGLEEQ